MGVTSVIRVIRVTRVTRVIRVIRVAVEPDGTETGLASRNRVDLEMVPDVQGLRRQ
jgi:hypothetical protein